MAWAGWKNWNVFQKPHWSSFWGQPLALGLEGLVLLVTFGRPPPCHCPWLYREVKGITELFVSSPLISKWGDWGNWGTQKNLHVSGKPEIKTRLKSRDITLSTKVHLVKAMVFPVVTYGCESWTVKKAECRRIDLNCGVGEDSWESLGLQGDPTSPFWRRSVLGVLWKEWC